MYDNKEQDESEVIWYRNPIIHFPLWLVFAFVYFNFSEKLTSNEGFFSLGLFITITGLWGIISKIFFFRIPFLGTFIYENHYVLQANFVLIAIGMLISVTTISIYGISVVDNFLGILIESLQL